MEGNGGKEDGNGGKDLGGRILLHFVLNKSFQLWKELEGKLNNLQTFPYSPLLPKILAKQIVNAFSFP